MFGQDGISDVLKGRLTFQSRVLELPNAFPDIARVAGPCDLYGQPGFVIQAQKSVNANLRPSTCIEKIGGVSALHRNARLAQGCDEAFNHLDF